MNEAENTILIVDDEPGSRLALEANLGELGCRLVIAESGRQALGLLQTLTPDLILMDVMMPGINGFELCRIIRAMPELAEVPILFLTALSDKSYLVDGMQAGADDFLTKPIHRQELLARTRTILRLNRYRKIVDQRKNLRELASRLSVSQEQERQRISQELHDDLGQDMFALKLTLEQLQAGLPAGATKSQAQMQKVVEYMDQAMKKIHLLAEGLRPPLLDTLGFDSAIRNLALGIGERAGIPVELDICASANQIKDPYAIVLYRVLQEALTNIIKHARATRIWVRLENSDTGIDLVIEDNGVGFQPQEAEGKGLGLDSMRDRLTVVGGTLRISGSASGSVVTACVPASC
jgi:Signal transduction histidine kinase